ncbi:hypothetical protein ACFVYF_01120 [Streptomyces sp. NPDC058274]|uniref:hypothetical protein n=1 Tax=Streptomyces sp. NPDC058274 TaxID=3346416 RepID=UPI0036EF95BC
MNTDTRVRCSVGVSISSSTATARSAYDSHAPAPGARSPPSRYRPVRGESTSSRAGGVSITQSTPAPTSPPCSVASRNRRSPAACASANGAEHLPRLLAARRAHELAS